MRKALYLLATLALFSLSMTNTWNYTPREKLLADIDSVYAIINEIHPDMFAYISREDFESHLAKTKLLVADSMTNMDFFNILAPLVATLGDGHTSLRFPFKELSASEVGLFPYLLEVDLRDSTAVIMKDYSDPPSEIPVGSRIYAVNGRKMPDLIGKMMKMVSGEKDHFRASLLGEYFSAFFFSIFKESLFEVDYIYKDTSQRVSVNGLPLLQRMGGTRLSSDPYLLSVDEENKIATIHFNTFVDPQKFAHFLDSTFSLIKENNISDLIIDIRKNPGGSSHLGNQLFQYISPVPFQQFGHGLMRVSHRQKKFVEKSYGFQTDDEPGIVTWESGALSELVDNDLRFTGNTYLLTSHFTFSSAASFAWAFRYFEMGTIIGMETGGLGVCFGDVISQELTNSQLQIGVSYKKFYQYGATDKSLHGALPHFEVASDKAMEYAVGMILDNRSPDN